MAKWTRVPTHPTDWVAQLSHRIFVNRRQFIAGTGAVVFTPVSALAADLEALLLGKTKLSFYWNEVDSRFSVVETPDFTLLSEDDKRSLKDAEASSGRKAEWVWDADPGTLGVDPDILLATHANGSHAVKILARGFGGSPGQKIEQATLTFVQRSKRWTIGGSTAVWGKSQLFGEIDFRAFLGYSNPTASAIGDSQSEKYKENRLALSKVAADGVFKTLARTFDGQFAVRQAVDIVLDNRLIWSVHSIPNTGGAGEPIELFGGQVVVRSIAEIRWNRRAQPSQTEQESLETDGVAYWASAEGSAKLKDDTLVVGRMNSFHLHFFDRDLNLLSKGDKLLTAEGVELPPAIPRYRLFFQVKKPSKAEMSEAVLKWDNWGVQVQQGHELYVGELAAKGELRRSMMPEQKATAASRSMKTVVAMDIVDPTVRTSGEKMDRADVERRGKEPAKSFDLWTRAGTLNVLPRKVALQKDVAAAPEVQDPGNNSTLQSSAIDYIDPTNRSFRQGKEIKSDIEFVHIALSLFAARLALPDASLSELTFDSTALSLVYDTREHRLPPSYVWLRQDAKPHELIARFDLTRAQISAARYTDLLSLNFRFADLVLAIPAGGKPYIAPLPDECRLIAQKPLDMTVDPRPVLVVEFPPQHVLEEALFRRQPEKPPQLDLEKHKIKDPRILLVEIAGMNVDERAMARQLWLNDAGADASFGEFAKSFAAAALLKKLPKDQRVYVGPFGLDAEGMAIARDLAQAKYDEKIDEILNGLAGELIKFRSTFKPSQPPTPPTDTALTEEQQVELERELVTNYPLYGVFKQFFNEWQVERLVKGEKPIDLDEPADEQPDLEFRLSKIKDQPKLLGYFKNSDIKFKGFLEAKDRPDDILQGRLANPTRLAFRVNCGPTGVETGRLPKDEVATAFPFSLDGLTDWSKHELAVTRRAQRLDEFTRDGLPDIPSRRIANLNDTDVLTFQGIGSGPYMTSQQRLSDIYAAMRDAPGPLETAIELPARLQLSPSQNAIWRIPRTFDKKYYSPKEDIDPSRLGVGHPVIEGEIVDKSAQMGTEYKPLWAVTLDHEAAPADVRAIHSPDFRPAFLWGNFSKLLSKGDQRLQVPGNKPPPRGPYAPWLLGREQSDDQTPAATTTYTFVAPEGKGALVCPDPGAEPSVKSGWSLPSLIAYLCGREAAQKGGKDSRLFRTSLDAYDRHELVLLSSAYGLPVQGAADENDQLKKDADQFASPPGFDLMDLEGDTAIYRPKTLDIRELTLTSVGGTFRHDTAFSPPAAAKFLRGDPLFDSLSIERWQHWIVLGRDVFTEVVYKGYLFPLGIRASLVKITERTFLRSVKGHIKAYLVQRMFIRCGKPEKRFPALRQPNSSRQFPCERLMMLTVTTPDIVDPASPVGPGKEIGSVILNIAGRLLRLKDNSGLMFWPRTAMSDKANVRFSISIDGRETELPLIFVDNTAVQDWKNIEALVKYYNLEIANPHAASGEAVIDRDLHLRSIEFRGQTLRYCDETKVGDSTIETQSWTVKAEGRQEHGNELAGDNSNYRFDAQMQGAEQPPFYPAVETTVVVLKQVERFSGGLARPVVAQFDGHYVGRGFPVPAGATGVVQEPIANKSEIYLNFIQPVVLDMGTKGDRSGGMYRPGNDFVAMSRSAGPVGGKDANGAVLRIATPGQLENWAKFFHYNELPPVKAGAENQSTSSGKPGATAGTGEAVKEKADLQDKFKVLKQYFSGNAKLLGMIRMDKLIEFVGIEALPVLNEVIEYGASAMHQADAAFKGIEAVLRDEVLTPLLRLISDLKDRWDKIQEESKRLVEGQPVQAPSLDQIFPEIGAGLRGLEAALVDAIATTDTIGFTTKVSRVYEAGQQLVRGLSLIAANPVGRISDALNSTLDKYKEIVLGKIQEIKDFVESLDDYLNNLRDKIIADIAKEVAAALVGNPGTEAQLSLTGDVKVWLDDISPKLEIAAAEIDGTGKYDVKTKLKALQDSIVVAATIKSEEIEKLVTELLLAAVTSDAGALQSAFNALAQKIEPVEKAQLELADAIKGALEEHFDIVKTFADYLLGIAGAALPGTALEKAVVTAYQVYLDVLEYKRKFDAIKDAIAELKPQVPSTLDGWAQKLDGLLPLLPSSVAPDASRLVAIVRGASRLQVAAKEKKIEVIVAESLSLLTPIVGVPVPLPGNLIVAADEKLKSFVQFLLAWTEKELTAAQSILKDAHDAMLEVHGGLAEFLENTKLIEAEVTALTGFGTIKTELLATIKVANNLEVAIKAESQRATADLDAIALEIFKTQKGLDALKQKIGDPWFEKLAPGSDLLLQLKSSARDFERVGSLIAESARSLARGVRDIANIPANQLLVVNGEYSLYVQLDYAIVSNAPLTRALADKAATLFSDLDKKVSKALQKASQAVVATAISSADILLEKAESGEGSKIEAVEGALLDAIADIGGFLGGVPREELFSVAFELSKASEKAKTLRQKLSAVEKKLQDYPPAGVKEYQHVRGLLDILAPELEAIVASAKNKDAFLEDLAVARNVSGRLVRAIDAVVVSLKARLASETVEFTYGAATALLAGWKGQAGSVNVNWPGILLAYEEIDKSRKDVLSRLANVPAYISAPLKEALILESGGKTPDVKDDRLSTDIILLKAFQGASTTDQKAAALAGLQPFIREWGRGNSSIFALAGQVEKLVSQVLKGDFAALIDFAAIRDEFEKQIKQLVPLRASLNYTLGGQFDQKRISDLKSLTAGIFEPQSGSSLEIDVSAKVEFLHPKEAEFNVKGKLGPFSIKLIGDFLDAVTIKFRGADFTVAKGRGPHLQVYYDDFVIGEDLKFVQKLQSYLMPEKGSGFFLRPLFSPLGIEAGYGVSLPIITLGNVSFSNISLNASLIIPFDGGDSRFRASLSRVDAPFTIAAAPFGGSGYFGIEANAEGIVGFDASFEYGGAAAFQFGPLKGIGRLMVGVYIRQTKVLIGSGDEAKYTNFTEILGTFYAGGTASIWIFNFSASLYVRLGMRGNQMFGEATFTFSFSSGFVDFDFSVTANRTESGLGKGSFNRYLNLPYMVAGDVPTANGKEQPEPSHFKTKRLNKTTCQGVDWRVYKKYFHDSDAGMGDFL